MRRSLAVTLGILLATLTLAGAGQAQDVATIQGTLQSVDCNTKALGVKTADGSEYRMYASPASTSVFVNSNPVSFCTLQQYVGSNVTVTVAPNGNQLTLKRVEVNSAANPSSAQNQPSGAVINGMPDWAKIALGVVIVGALVYLGSQKHDPPPPSQGPYYQCGDGSWRSYCPDLPPQSQPSYQCRDGSWRSYCPDLPPQSQPYYQCRDGSWRQYCSDPHSQPYYQCRDGSWRQYCSDPHSQPYYQCRDGSWRQHCP